MCCAIMVKTTGFLQGEHSRFQPRLNFVITIFKISYRSYFCKSYSRHVAK